MARRDEDDGEELMPPESGGGFVKLAILIGVCLVGGVILIGLASRGRDKIADRPVTKSTDNVSDPLPSSEAVPEREPVLELPAPPSDPTPFESTAPTLPTVRTVPNPPISREPAKPKPKPPTPKTPLLKSDPPEPKSVVIKADGLTLTIRSLKKKDQLGKWEPDKGFSIYVADIELASADAKNVKYNPRLFKLKDKLGRESTATLRTFDGALGSGTLKKGERVRGTVAFSARTDAKGLTLSLAPPGSKKPLIAKLTE